MNLKGMGLAGFIFFAMGIWIYRVIITLNKIKQREKLSEPEDKKE